MMRTKCYSVRLDMMIKVTEKAYKAIGFDGREAIIPASQVFGRDNDACKSEAWWISAWILEKKTLQYSTKKQAYFDNNTRRQLPNVIYHKAAVHGAVYDNTIEELKR